MAEKEFIVTHRRARSPLTVHGKTLKEALKNEGLDPKIWHLAESPQTTVLPPDDTTRVEVTPD